MEHFLGKAVKSAHNFLSYSTLATYAVRVVYIFFKCNCKIISFRINFVSYKRHSNKFENEQEIRAS